MSQLRCFTIVGDSNVRRHLLSSDNSRGREPMSSAQFIPGGGRLSVLSTSLSSVRSESDACVLACVTNLITGSIPASSLSLRVEPMISGFLERALVLARSRPDLQVFVCPPMYRTSPIWYRDGMSEIIVKFSSLVRAIPDRPPNFWCLPGFYRARLEPDGVHLDPYSGLQYALYLVEAPQEVLKAAALPADLKIASVIETSRSLEDRVSILEQDNISLRKNFEQHGVVSSELFDYEANIRNEVFFMIQGLPRLPKMDQKEWQVKAVADVNRVLGLMGLTYEVMYVQNSTGRGKDSKTLYKAKVVSSEVSRIIRNKFASYFSGGTDSRPEALSNISLRNCVTPGTLARIAVLQLLAKRYKESNPGSRSQVVAYEARPLLKLTPPPEASDRRVLTFNYVEAISKLPTSFTPDEISSLMKRVSPSLHGNLKSVLGVLNDDMIPRKQAPRRKAPPGSSVADGSGSVADATSGSESSEFRTPEGSSTTSKTRKRTRVGTGSGPSAKK